MNGRQAGGGDEGTHMRVGRCRGRMMGKIRWNTAGRNEPAYLTPSVPVTFSPGATGYSKPPGLLGHFGRAFPEHPWNFSPYLTGPFPKLPPPLYPPHFYPNPLASSLGHLP